jgi:hypothetical protein
MGVPTAEVGYTSATAGRGDHEVHKGHVVALWGGGERLHNYLYNVAQNILHLNIFLKTNCVQPRWFNIGNPWMR